MNLNAFWFVLVGVLLTGYAVLDGFDLGTGPLLLCTRSDHERRVFLNAIGPIWNGNGVWLVTGGGALFAAFPQVVATVMSGFYDLFMLLLVALIFRAAAIEFRSQRPGTGWRTTWDVAFAISSILSAFLLGVAVGNIIWGIPLDSAREYEGSFLTLLHPYALFTGLTTVVLFIMHANVYLVLKTDGPLREKLMRWTTVTVPAYLACFVAFNALTLFGCPHIVAAFRERPLDPERTFHRRAGGDVQHRARDLEKTARARFREFLRGAGAASASVRYRRLSEPGLLDPEPCP